MSKPNYSITSSKRKKKKGPVHINEAEYNDIKSAKEFLEKYLEIEKAFHILMKNYEDFEKTSFSITMDRMLRQTVNHIDIHMSIIETNRMMINLMTACRAYFDQTSANLSKGLGETGFSKDNFNTLRNEEYDNFLEYRVLEALRNYVQHRGMPIQRFSMPGERSRIGDLEFGIEFSLNTKILLQSKSFKNTVAQEINNIGDYYELKLATRVYIARINHIHHAIRNKLSEEFDSKTNLIRTTIQRFYYRIDGLNADNLNPPKYLNINESRGDTVTSSFQIYNEQYELIENLQMLNPNNEALQTYRIRT